MTSITILVDNTAPDGLACEHGLAICIEHGQRMLLFDTGQSDIIKRNAQTLGIDLRDVDTIVLSHGHYDHTGGLMTVLDEARSANLYLHPQAAKPKFACYKDKPSRNIGIPYLTESSLADHKHIKSIIWTEKPTDVYPGFTITGPIPRHTDFEDVGGPFFLDTNGQIPDTLIDDQAMFFQSGEGLVVIVGCAHSGIVNTLDYIAQLTGQTRIHSVIGGIHLRSASNDRIKHTIDAFRNYHLQQIALAHCTGDNAVGEFRKTLGQKCFSCSVGSKNNYL
jgi:7,8-dihydropterin-6-yl-methyl-4-(beta-D-ribofuranosyl)aminobenzene 5'-phosphate synthase